MAFRKASTFCILRFNLLRRGCFLTSDIRHLTTDLLQEKNIKSCFFSPCSLFPLFYFYFHKRRVLVLRILPLIGSIKISKLKSYVNSPYPRNTCFCGCCCVYLNSVQSSPVLIAFPPGYYPATSSWQEQQQPQNRGVGFCIIRLFNYSCHLINCSSPVFIY